MSCSSTSRATDATCPTKRFRRSNAANGGYVVMRNGEQFNASLQDFTGNPLIAVFSNGRRATSATSRGSISVR